MLRFHHMLFRPALVREVMAPWMTTLRIGMSAIGLHAQPSSGSFKKLGEGGEYTISFRGVWSTRCGDHS